MLGCSGSGASSTRSKARVRSSKRRQRHLCLEAREVGTEAVVRTEAEGEMLVVAAADVEAVRLGKHVVVAVRRAEPADDDLVGVDAAPCISTGRVARRGSSCTGDAKRSTSSTADGSSARSARKRASSRGMSISASDGVADQVGRGLVAGDEQQDQHLQHLLAAEVRALELGLHQAGEQVLLRLAAALVGECARSRRPSRREQAVRGSQAAPASADGRARCRAPRTATSDHALNCSRSAAGMPMISAITMTGSG